MKFLQGWLWPAQRSMGKRGLTVHVILARDEASVCNGGVSLFVGPLEELILSMIIVNDVKLLTWNHFPPERLCSFWPALNFTTSVQI